MNLSDRKKKILSAVIDENISSASPVSSKQLQEGYLKDVSSATIRSELATLEELGFLYHPHTSSGRLPTLEGIKFYIDEILPTIKAKKIDNIADAFDLSLDNMSAMLKSTAKAISEATNYTSIMYIGMSDFAKISQIGLIKLDEKSTLVAIITDRGIIKDVVELDKTSEELSQASKILTEIFNGKTLKQIEESDFLITQEIEKYKYMFKILIDMISKQEHETERIAIEGKDKIFNYPEFSDVDKVKSAVTIFEEPKQLFPMLDDDTVEVSIEIGEDSPVKDCAIVTASYKVGGKTIGKAGVLGPARMDYKNVLSVLKGISESIGQKLNKENKDEEK